MQSPRSQNGIISTFFASALFSISTKLVAFMLQSVAILSIISYYAYQAVVLGEPVQYRVVVGLPAALIVLSILWSNRCQEFIAKSSVCGVSARYKSGKEVCFSESKNGLQKKFTFKKVKLWQNYSSIIRYTYLVVQDW